MFFKILSFFKGLFYFTGSYSNDVFPEPLCNEEEKECIDKMINGDVLARNKLIEHNLRLVAHIIKKFETIGVSTDDLISIGTIGLIKGIDTYNPLKRIKITTYIAKCVENEVLMYFRSNKKYLNDVSLNDYIGVDKDGNEVTLEDVIQDNKEDLFNIVFKKISIDSLKKYLDILNDKEKNIIIKRYGLYGSDIYTQKDIASELKISRSYVSRIEKRALIKLYREFYKKN